MKFTQNEDLHSLLFTESDERSLFMEVSGFDQCFYGSGYSMEFLERTGHFYSNRPQLWRGWNNFGEALRLTRRLLVLMRVPPYIQSRVAETRHQPYKRSRGEAARNYTSVHDPLTTGFVPIFPRETKDNITPTFKKEQHKQTQGEIAHAVLSEENHHNETYHKEGLR